MYNKEFQAIVLAGGTGSRLTEIRGDRPKCLLEVGKFPMIFYPLNLLQNHGFVEATVVVVESQKGEIQQVLEKLPLEIKIELATIPSDTDFGTAETLKHISESIKSDFLVISCDVVTNAKLYPLMNQFREHNAAIAALFLPGGQEKSATAVPGPKIKNKPERDLIGVHPETNRLVYLASISDLDEKLHLPGHLLRKNGRMVLHSKLLDSHIYLMKKWVVEFLVESKGFFSLKGELLPFLIKKQMSRPKAANDSDKISSEVNVNVKFDDIFNFVSHSELEKKITDTSLFNDSVSKKPYNSDVLRCYATLAPKDTFGLRINTVTSFWAVNQKISEDWDRILGDKKAGLISASATVNSTQITACSVADNANISEKTSLKNSVIGPYSVVNPKTRISDSILMNNVTVEEGVVIENCIICEKAVIKRGAVLKSSLIGPGFVVTENSSHEKQHLGSSDDFMEIE